MDCVVDCGLDFALAFGWNLDLVSGLVLGLAFVLDCAWTLTQPLARVVALLVT